MTLSRALMFSTTVICSQVWAANGSNWGLFIGGVWMAYALFLLVSK